MSSVVRRIPIPLAPGWPSVVELRERGGPRALFADGTVRTFVLESDLFAAYGWTPQQIRAWAAGLAADQDDYRGEETAWVLPEGAEEPALEGWVRQGWRIVSRRSPRWLLRHRL
jgi:hypothetical protein